MITLSILSYRYYCEVLKWDGVRTIHICVRWGDNEQVCQNGSDRKVTFNHTERSHESIRSENEEQTTNKLIVGLTPTITPWILYISQIFERCLRTLFKSASLNVNNSIVMFRDTGDVILPRWSGSPITIWTFWHFGIIDFQSSSNSWQRISWSNQSSIVAKNGQNKPTRTIPISPS